MHATKHASALPASTLPTEIGAANKRGWVPLDRSEAMATAKLPAQPMSFKGGDVEIRRVSKAHSSGQVLSLDFNRPPNGILRSAYLAYLTVVGAALGWILHRDPDTYRYIPASIRQYPGAEAVARLFEARGFSAVRCYPVLGGLMTIHHAIRT